MDVTVKFEVKDPKDSESGFAWDGQVTYHNIKEKAQADYLAASVLKGLFDLGGGVKVTIG